jgi:hypothetical protein
MTHNLYKREFRALAEHCIKTKVACAANDLYGVNLNIQVGRAMRYECHIDSNPIQGMLYVTSHSAETGGQLIVANQPGVVGVENVKKDCVIIEPREGSLIYFDARRFSHLVEPLIEDSMLRVAVAMNFYTSLAPESLRPRDLNKHLGLE